jgi:glycosyltransferase involved in cell wall biosynthesis
MHDIATVIEVAKRGLPPGFVLTFHSSGTGYGELLRAIGNTPGINLDRIHFHGALSDDGWRAALNRHSIALVTLREGAQHVSMPSKTYSGLAAGQAILGICPADSDLAELIRQHDCGWSVSPGNVDDLMSLLVHVSNHLDELRGKCMRAFQAGHSLYDMSTISKQYLDLFEQLIEASGPDARSPRHGGVGNEKRD